MMVNLILAEENELTRIGLRTVFKNSNVQIIGEAKSATELLSLLKSFEADVVLIDYTSTNFSIDVIPEALELRPKIKFTAITPLQSGKTLIDALKSGVSSHVKKDCSIEEIKDAVNETALGKKFFCGEILETIRKEDINIEELADAEFSCDPIAISEREIEIITLIAEGLTNIEISEKLFLSKHTVTTHRKNIMQKLGVKNTAGVVMYAVKQNYSSPNKFLFSPKEDI